jgi:hypothetical protein
MAVREMKRATDARKSLVKREVATVELLIATSVFAVSCAGQPRAVKASAVDNVSQRRVEYE